MFIPISDDNALKHLPFQHVTTALVGANVVVFLLLLGGRGVEAAAVSYGVIPAVFLDGAALPPDYAAVPLPFTLITYQFLHAGWLHLLSNMAFLWVFGDNVEDAMGHMRFLAFYLLCGVSGALAHGFIDPHSTVPLVGASGSVAGVIAAYLVLHPRVKVWVLVLWRLPLRLTAMWVLGFWVVLQFVMVAIPFDDGVAWWAHIGGLLAGAGLIVVMRRPGVALLDRGLVAAPQPHQRRQR